MTKQDLIGLYEIAAFAGVSPSAVTNWRKRFSDFPPPLADLKSGPVFSGSEIEAWIGKRQGKEQPDSDLYYDQLAAKRGDDPELMAKVKTKVGQVWPSGGQLLSAVTSIFASDRPLIS